MCHRMHYVLEYGTNLDSQFSRAEMFRQIHIVRSQQIIGSAHNFNMHMNLHEFESDIVFTFLVSKCFLKLISDVMNSTKCLVLNCVFMLILYFDLCIMYCNLTSISEHYLKLKCQQNNYLHLKFTLYLNRTIHFLHGLLQSIWMI